MSLIIDCTASWQAHDGIVLSSLIISSSDEEVDSYMLITGGNDNNIKVSRSHDVHLNTTYLMMHT